MLDIEPVTWERKVPGSDVAVERTVVWVGIDGQARVPESLLGQLLLDAGWERTS